MEEYHKEYLRLHVSWLLVISLQNPKVSIVIFFHPIKRTFKKGLDIFMYKFEINLSKINLKFCWDHIEYALFQLLLVIFFQIRWYFKRFLKVLTLIEFSMRFGHHIMFINLLMMIKIDYFTMCVITNNACLAGIFIGSRRSFYIFLSMLGMDVSPPTLCNLMFITFPYNNLNFTFLIWGKRRILSWLYMWCLGYICRESAGDMWRGVVESINKLIIVPCEGSKLSEDHLS